MVIFSGMRSLFWEMREGDSASAAASSSLFGDVRGDRFLVCGSAIAFCGCEV
ncbi:MAG: hypothetical protein ACKPH4_08265 [Microcystis panniformis]